LEPTIDNIRMTKYMSHHKKCTPRNRDEILHGINI